jgi:ABC-2 type transport system ATP-binding protein
LTEAAIRTQSLRKVYPVPKPRRWGGQRPAAGAGAQATPPGEIVALEGLDLEVAEGEFFGLLGPNGAGKTTTIGVLTTRVRLTSGSAWVAGHDVVRESVAVKQRIGVVPQRPNPDNSLSVRENLVFHGTYFGLATAEATARAHRLLERFEIGDRADSKVKELSGGQQQRLMIARALMHDPEVLFLDEPTGGLDPKARLALWDALREMHGEGRTIVLTTHYMEEADRLCQRLAIVDRGRLLALDTPAGLKSQAPGGTLIELHLDGDASPAAGQAGTLAGVHKTEAVGERLLAYADRPGEVMAGLIRSAESAGRAVHDIHLSPPSLETLFVSMTGRRLE